MQGAGRPKESEGRKGIGLHEYETGVRVLPRKASLSEDSGIKRATLEETGWYWKVV